MAVAHARFLEKPRELRKGQTAWNIALKGKPRPKPQAKLSEMIHSIVNTSAVASPIKVILKSSEPNLEKIVQLRKLFFDPYSSFTIKNLFHTDRLSEVDKERLFRYVVALIATHAKLQHPFKQVKVGLPPRVEPPKPPAPKPFVGPSRPPAKAVVQTKGELAFTTGDRKEKYVSGRHRWVKGEQPLGNWVREMSVLDEKRSLPNKVIAQPNPEFTRSGEFIIGKRRAPVQRKAVGISPEHLADLVKRYTRYLDLAISRKLIKPSEREWRLRYLQEQAKMWGSDKLEPIMKKLDKKVEVFRTPPPRPQAVARVPEVRVERIRNELVRPAEAEVEARWPEARITRRKVADPKEIEKVLARYERLLQALGFTKENISSSIQNMRAKALIGHVNLDSIVRHIDANLEIYPELDTIVDPLGPLKYPVYPVKKRTEIGRVTESKFPAGEPYAGAVQPGKELELHRTSPQREVERREMEVKERVATAKEKLSSEEINEKYFYILGLARTKDFVVARKLIEEMPTDYLKTELYYHMAKFSRDPLDIKRARECAEKLGKDSRNLMLKDIADLEREIASKKPTLAKEGQQEFDFMEEPFVKSRETRLTESRRDAAQTKVSSKRSRMWGPLSITPDPKQMEIEFENKPVVVPKVDVGKTAQKAVADLATIVDRALKTDEPAPKAREPPEVRVAVPIPAVREPAKQTWAEAERGELLKHLLKLNLPISNADMISFFRSCVEVSRLTDEVILRPEPTLESLRPDFRKGVSVEYDVTQNKVIFTYGPKETPLKGTVKFEAYYKPKTFSFSANKNTIYVITDKAIFVHPQKWLKSLGYSNDPFGIVYAERSQKAVVGIAFFDARTKKVTLFGASSGEGPKPSEEKKQEEPPAGLQRSEDWVKGLDGELEKLTERPVESKEPSKVKTVKEPPKPAETREDREEQKDRSLDHHGGIDRNKAKESIGDLHAEAGSIVRPPGAATLGADSSYTDLEARREIEHTQKLFGVNKEPDQLYNGENLKDKRRREHARALFGVGEKGKKTESPKLVAEVVEERTVEVEEQRETQPLGSLAELKGLQKVPQEEEIVKPKEVSIYKSATKHPVTVQQIGFKTIEELPALKESQRRGLIFCDTIEEADSYLGGERFPPVLIYSRPEVVERRLRNREDKKLCLVVDFPAKLSFLKEFTKEFLTGIVSLEPNIEGLRPVPAPLEPIKDGAQVSGEAVVVKGKPQVQQGPSVQVNAESYPQGGDTVMIRKIREEDTVPRGQKTANEKGKKVEEEQQNPADLPEDDDENNKPIVFPKIPDSVKYGAVLKLPTEPENLDRFVKSYRNATDPEVKTAFETKIKSVVEKCEKEGRLGLVVLLLKENLPDNINVAVTYICADNGWVGPIADFLENRSLDPETRKSVEKHLAIGFVNAASQGDYKSIIEVLDKHGADTIFSRDTFLQAIKILSLSSETAGVDYSKEIARFSKVLRESKPLILEEERQLKELSHRFEETLSKYLGSRNTTESAVVHKKLLPDLLFLVDKLVASAETPTGEIIFRNLVKKHYAQMFAFLELKDFFKPYIWAQIVHVSKEDINTRRQFLDVYVRRLDKSSFTEEQQKDLEHLRALQK